MVLHPASITPEPMKRCCFRKTGQRMRRSCAKIIPLRCGFAGTAGRLDSVRDIERVTGASQFLGLAWSRGRARLSNLQLIVGETFYPGESGSKPNWEP